MQLVKFFSKKVFEKITMLFTAIFLWGFYSLPALARDDDLAGVMGSVRDTFGMDSTFIKLLYLLEIIVGVYTYHKTKNIAAMLGIIFISVFLTYALPHWVFK
jgi:type IV conjugative transfer system pilin TraA